MASNNELAPTANNLSGSEGISQSASNVRIVDAKRLTEEYKARERERQHELLTEVDQHYFADNDATGAKARVHSTRTDEGDLQTTVTRSPAETIRFLSRKAASSTRADALPGEQASERKVRELFHAVREQVAKRVAATTSSDVQPTWLQDALGLDAGDETIPAMDIVFDKVDALLSAGRFEEVNEIIDRVPLEGPSLSFLMGILTITLPAAERLSNRPKFFDRLYRLCKAMGRDADDLLGGLRQWRGAHGSGLLGR